MKDYLQKSQKIKVTCIVRNGDKILLLRSTEVADREHQPRGGYFDIPSFTVSFGEDPRATLERTLESYLGEVIDTVSVLDVRQYMSDNQATQVFDMLFTAETINNIEIEERLGKFMFVAQSELDVYMFPKEKIYLEKYL